MHCTAIIVTLLTMVCAAAPTYHTRGQSTPNPYVLDGLRKAPHEFSIGRLPPISEVDGCWLDDDQWNALRRALIDSIACTDCSMGWAGDVPRLVVVRPVGPDGSSAYWNIQFAMLSAEGELEGLCLGASTMGYRGIGHLIYDDLVPFFPLEWFKDLDGDGLNELILWDSVLTVEELLSTNADYALVPRIYQLRGNKLIEKASLGRLLYQQVAAVYDGLGRDTWLPPGIAAAIRVYLAESTEQR